MRSCVDYELFIIENNKNPKGESGERRSEKHQGRTCVSGSVCDDDSFSGTTVQDSDNDTREKNKLNSKLVN